MELQVDNEALSLLAALRGFLSGRGIKAYLVGGLVRDLRLGRATADIDIAVAGDALEVAPEIAAELKGRYVLLDEENGVGRVVLPGGRRMLDISSLRGDIEHDLAQRDFTVDAMAIDLGEMGGTGQEKVEARLIDPCGGEADLGRRVIRAVSESVFTADAARLWRAARLAAELDFTIDKDTESLMGRHSHLVAGVAGERVKEELLRFLAVPGAGRRLALLEDMGLVTATLPELGWAKGVGQPKEHYWDVFDHSVQTVVAVEVLFKEADWDYADGSVLGAASWSAELEEHFGGEVGRGASRKALVKLAALLHDIAKPQTKAIDAGGRMRFLGHAGEGAEVVAGILRRLRFSGKQVKLVETMVRHHLRPGQMSRDEMPSRRAIYRYFRDTGEAAIDTLFLSLADHLAARGPQLDGAQWRAHAEMIGYVLARRFEEEAVVVPPRLIDGHDLIDGFGMRPGPDIGQLLEAVREAQAAGEVVTKEAALAYVRRRLSSPALATNNLRGKRG